MISSAYGFIFLHAPKTGGNSMQLLLQPYSDDHLVNTGGAEAPQRFGVKGPVTRWKHAKLRDYTQDLGPGLAGHRVVLTTRDPLARAVSLYFSPQRWQRRGPDGELGNKQPAWDFDRFLNVLESMDRLVDFVIVNQGFRRPDMVVRLERLKSDFDAFAQAVGLPISASDLPHANVSAGSAELRRQVMDDPAVRRAVETRFAEDYAFLAGLER